MNNDPKNITNTSIYQFEPHDFSSTMEVVACYIELNGKLLLLKRAKNKPEGGKWSVPAGKVEKNENIRQAVMREIFEETNISLDEKKLKFIGKIFIRRPDIDFVFHMYHENLNQLPKITLNEENLEYCWLFPNEINEFPIVSGGVEAIQHFRTLANNQH